jgi:alkylation response protein AidB-like acyl-CoA dehydrogenase
MRQRLAQLYIESELLRLIRLRTVTAAVKGKPPGAEASIRKLLADEHGQKLMLLAKDLCGPDGMLTDRGPLQGSDDFGWHYGFLFSMALTVGGGTTQVQRNIVGERVLGLPHDTDVEQGKTWREARAAS